VQRSSIQS
jgi:ribonuclease HI